MKKGRHDARNGPAATVRGRGSTEIMAVKLSTETTDEELVESLKRGDEEAFVELMRRYKSRVFATAYRYLGNYEDAADVVQEVFVKVYRHIGSYSARAKLYTWIYRIAVNTAVNRLRTRKRRGEEMAESLDKLKDEGMPVPVAAGVNPGPNPLESLERKELASLLQKKLDALPEHYRMVFVLRELQQFSYQEIAEMTDLPIGTVKSRLNKARRSLRDMLAPYLAPA